MRSLALVILLVTCSTPQLSRTEVEPIEPQSPEEQQEREAAVAHVAVLANPEGEITIGSHCYFSGQPPVGRRELDELVRMNRVDLMRRLLRAPSVEARIYAAIGLRRAGAMSRDELKSFLSAIDGTVRVCAGCIVSHVPASEAAAYYAAFDDIEL